MLAGQPVDAFYASVAHADLLAIGLNCATGPDLMTDHIRTLANMASTRISCYPNAGLPNEDDQYLETPESLAGQLSKFVEQGWLNIVGGCCGTTPAHIRAMAEMTDGRAPACRKPAIAPRLLFRRRAGRGRRQHPSADRRRAHERHRLAPVQKNDRRGKVGRSQRNRPLAGEERRPHHRRLPAVLRPRRDQGHRPLLFEADAQDQGSGDGRHHRSQSH